MGVLALALCAANQTNAQQPAAFKNRADTTRRVVDTVKVTGRIDDLIGSARRASEGRVAAVDLRARPITREGELLKMVPGLMVTHARSAVVSQLGSASFIRPMVATHNVMV